MTKISKILVIQIVQLVISLTKYCQPAKPIHAKHQIISLWTISSIPLSQVLSTQDKVQSLLTKKQHLTKRLLFQLPTYAQNHRYYIKVSMKEDFVAQIIHKNLNNITRVIRPFRHQQIIRVIGKIIMNLFMNLSLMRPMQKHNVYLDGNTKSIQVLDYLFTGEMVDFIVSCANAYGEALCSSTRHTRGSQIQSTVSIF